MNGHTFWPTRDVNIKQCQVCGLEYDTRAFPAGTRADWPSCEVVLAEKRGKREGIAEGRKLERADIKAWVEPLIDEARMCGDDANADGAMNMLDGILGGEHVRKGDEWAKFRRVIQPAIADGAK